MNTDTPEKIDPKNELFSAHRSHSIPIDEEEKKVNASPVSEAGTGDSLRSSTGRARSTLSKSSSTFNMLVIGKKGSGKSSFMARYCRD